MRYSKKRAPGMYHHRNRNPKKSVYFTVKGEPRVNYQECDFYNCSLYSLGKDVRHYKCTCHSIKTERLEEIVLKVIRETCEYVQLNEEDFVQAVTDASMQVFPPIRIRMKTARQGNLGRRRRECKPLQMGEFPSATGG